MPEMDGFQAIEAIRNGSTENKSSRILAITAKEYSAFLDSMTAFINWVDKRELE